MRAALLVALLVVSCGGPAAQPPNPFPSTAVPTVAAATSAPTTAPTSSPTATPRPTATATARPTATPAPTRIVLPTTVELSTAGSTVLWTLVARTRLFRSLDRGTTWEERTLPRDLFGGAFISFQNEREGWVLLTALPGTQCQQEEAELWHTTDGASNWTIISPNTLTTNQCKSSVTFLDAFRGFVTAYDTSRQPNVVRTRDGAKTWASTALADPPGSETSTPGHALQPGRILVFGPTLYLVANGFTASGTAARYLYRSTDVGATWTFTDQLTTDDVLVTATRWLRFVPRAMQESTDAGATWHAYTSDYSQAAPVAPSVVFADANVGYATVRGSIQRTTDGGAHWTLIKTPGT